jgi:replicative DNA helicase
MELSQPIHRLKRRARLLSRREGIPLHAALDRVAREEGYSAWSMLAARSVAPSPAGVKLSQLADGDLLLLAGRPGQGKTLLSLDLAVQAVKAGRTAVFFTLEYNHAEVLRCVAAIGADPGSLAGKVRIDTSDDISADHIIRQLQSAARGTLVIVDYLQLLDQKRENPTLSQQVKALRAFGQERGLVFVFLSQIHRSFDGAGKDVPSLADVRLPNPLDLTLFTKACFVHGDKVSFGPLGGSSQTDAPSRVTA